MKRHLCMLTVLAWTPGVWSAALPRTTYRVTTVAGSSQLGDGGPATDAQMGAIQGIAVDRGGNLYLADTDHHRVRRIAPNGAIGTLAGTGTAGYSGDGGPAGAAQLNLPYGLATDAAGYVYVADLGNNRVRRIGPDGIIVTVAGTGVQGSAGDGGPATGAQLLTPRNVATDAAGNLYISEFGGHRVRKVSPDGRIATVAGTGVAGFRGDGGAAVSAQLAFPAGLAVDRTGALYIADSQNQRVRKMVPGGTIATVLGGSSGTRLLTPMAVAPDLSGGLYVADSSAAVRAAAANGAWINVAGTGVPGFSGDFGPARAAQLAAPRDLALDAMGNLYIADGVRIRQVDLSGTMHTVAGDGYLQAIGDGGPAVSAALLQPSAIVLDAAGGLYIADTGTERVRKVQPSGVIVTVAGNGLAAAGGEQVPAPGAPLFSPMGVALDPAGNLLIAETLSHRIRKVTPGGVVGTAAGTGVEGMGPELLPPAETPLSGPRGMCLDRAGALYIVDTGNHRVLRVPAGGVVETAAGNGAAGNAGDGSKARLAQLNQPSACALDSAGDLYIADTGNHSIRKVTPDGVIGTVAGTGAAGATGDEGPATAASLDRPRGVAADDNGILYIADTGNNRIRRVTPDGVIHTIAGQDAAGFAGDGGPALAALLSGPAGLVLDGAGDLYFADSDNNRIRCLTPDAAAPPEPVVLWPTVDVFNAASSRKGPVAPGEIVTIYGTGMGPASGMAGDLDSAGLMAAQLGGTEVRFDGTPAPLFYAQSGQINAQAPYTLAGSGVTHIEVLYQGKPAGAADVPVAGAVPALFAAVVNQDGSLNAQTAAAPLGSIVTLYGTGEGLTDGANMAGQPAGAPYARPRQPVTLSIAGMTAEVLYAGSAPGLIGVLQVNARVPAEFVPTGAVPLALMVGAAAAPELTIWLK